MQVKRTDLSDTKVKLSVSLDEKRLSPVKQRVLERLGKNVKLQGFRQGKAPMHVVEKNVDQQLLQREFMDEALNEFYTEAAQNEKLRPIDRPQISLTKFVPFTTLEFEAEVEILGSVKLPDWKKIKKTKPKAEVTEQDITEVIKNLKTRAADKKDVDRAAKDGDQVWIDFKGVDAKGEPVKGADGKDYPLALGSKTFIPGFEENLVGLKPKATKEFTITFPKDYGVSALQSKKVTFTVTVNKVQEVVEPKLDDAFAAKLGPFKTVKELKDSIKKELSLEKQNQAEREFEAKVVEEIAEKSKMNLPETLIQEQVVSLLQELKQNLAYRGQTYNEYLEQEKTTDEDLRKELKPRAEKRVKTGLVLAEISNEEKITVTEEEIQIRLQLLKGQHQDPQAQAELAKPEATRQIASQLMTEKTIKKIIDETTK